MIKFDHDFTMKQTPTNTENDFRKYFTTKQMMCKTKSRH